MGEAKGAGMRARPLLVLLLAAVVLASGLAVFQHFAPGAMSPDSISMLSQARSNIFEDGHPPFVTWVWQWLDRVVPGPEPLLVLHLALFYGGLFLVFTALAPKYGWPVLPACAAVALWPPVVAILGAIWTDITMASFFLAAAGLWLHGAGSRSSARSFWLSALALAGIALAVASRHNAAAAAYPLLALFVLPACMRRTTPGRALAASLAIGALLTGAMFAVTKQVSARLVDQPRHLWRAAALYDIAGTSFFAGQDLFRPGLAPNASMASIRGLYSPRSYFPLALGEQIHAIGATQAPQRFPALEFDTTLPDLNARLLENWREVIVHHPREYLRHRTEFFDSMVHRKPWGLWAPMFDVIYRNDLGVEERPQTHDSWYFAQVRELSATSPMFEPFAYLVIAGLLVVPVLLVGLRQGDRTLLTAAALYGSGLAHAAGVFAVAVTPDFRYSHWTITATALATALVAVACIRPLATRVR